MSAKLTDIDTWLDLVQLSTGRRIQPRVLHALEAGLQTPSVTRFLAQIILASRIGAPLEMVTAAGLVDLEARAVPVLDMTGSNTTTDCTDNGCSKTCTSVGCTKGC